MAETRVVSEGRKLECVGDVCVTDSGQLEIHLDTTDPFCAQLAKLIAERVIAGESTQYVFDKPSETHGKASPTARKR